MIEHPASISALSMSFVSLPPTISGLVDRWQGIGAFADVDCCYEAARRMRRCSRNASQHWPHVVAASRRLGIAGVGHEWMAGRAAAAMQVEAA